MPLGLQSCSLKGVYIFALILKRAVEMAIGQHRLHY